MGYTNDTNMKQFIPPVACAKTAGTWTPTVTSDVISDVRTATAATFKVFIPLNPPSSSAFREGSQIASVDIWYNIGTADFTDFANVTVEQQTLTADGSAVTAAAYTTVTIDANHATAALRKVQGNHKMTVTFTGGLWITDKNPLYINLDCSAAATSTFSFLGAQINYTDRN